MQEGEDELSGFLSPYVYLSRYVPKGRCKCGVRAWGRVTNFKTEGKMWRGYTVCTSCLEKHYWKINPDEPIEKQAVKSSLPLEDKEEE